MGGAINPVEERTFPQLSDTTYRIESVLGAGGGGVVYRAWHERLQKHVVLKRIKEDSGLSQEQFRIEVDILKNLKHSYLPQLYDFLVDSSGVYTVMEFIPGNSFSDLLKSGYRFTQQQVVYWAAQLSSALSYLHQQNPPVLHSDIKPANIMLTPHGDVCLIDFNISLVLDGSEVILGLSHGYTSPEQYMPLPASTGGESAGNPGYTDLYTVLSNDADNPGSVTEINSTGVAAQTLDSVKPSSMVRRERIRMDARSDIYSLGATLYHLLTGAKPAISTGEIKPLRDFGLPFSEGVIYIIERCMQKRPEYRFQTAAELHDAVVNIHKYDARWKAAKAKRRTAAILFPVMLTVFALTAFSGYKIMAQEKEERYYTAVYEIENGDNPQVAYDNALEMFWDRIDPYRAMAMRLWDDGDIEACRDYIEQNLGNIAKFQSDADAAGAFGDIYFILGNCYYYGAGEPDYNLAAGNFEIAVRFVTDNPVYYRDYAIALARTGRTDEAQRVLRQAQLLDLETDSLNLSNGEIAFANLNYEEAIVSFGKVIDSTNDDYLRYRAYRTSDEIFKLLGQPERSVALLTNALNRIPLSRVPEMTERLADAYIKSGDYESAVALFEHLLDNAVAHFHLFEGLVIMLQELGDFDRAVSVLDRMNDLFPNDYRVPMRLAFLEADRQMGIANEERDYVMVGVYYNNAVALYNNNVRPGETDAQMQQLDLLIEQLRLNGWID